MKYGIKCHSTMTGITFYILEDEREICLQRFQEFINYCHEVRTEVWERYVSTSQVYCDEDNHYSFSVGKLDSGNYVLVTDLGCNSNEENRAIEFELLGIYSERF